jgi:hypothetical protein
VEKATMHSTATLARLAAGLAAVAIAGSGTLASAQNPSDAEKTVSTITLRVYDYANVDRKAMLEAEGEATRILADAGVHARWVDCPIRHADLGNYAGCLAAWQWNDYALRLEPTAMAASQDKSEDRIGYAVICDNRACPANVYYDRVRGLAGGNNAPSQILLGRVMAHEIGHLLLGPSHTRTDIMQGAWSGRQLDMEAAHSMLFTPEQSRAMKTRLAAQEQASVSATTVAVLGNAPGAGPASRSKASSK